MGLISFSVRNPVVVNMLVVLLIATGVPAYFFMVRELFPILPQDRVQIRTVYVDASPEDIEKQITAPIEREIIGLDGIKDITSVSIEGLSVITLELEVDADPDDVVRDVQAEVDAIDFPDDAEDPEVRELKYDWPIVNLALRAPHSNFVDPDAIPLISEKRLKDLAEDLKDLLIEVPGVSRVTIVGVREREIQVLADLDRLHAFQISLPMLAQALIEANRDLPAGALENSRQEFLVRTQEDFSDLDSIRRVIVRANRRGGKVTIDDVAEVADAFEDRKNFARVNGEASVVLLLQKKAEGDALRIKKDVDEVVEQFLAQTPEPITIIPFIDFSFAIRERLSVMQFNAALGLTIVMTCLCLFLDLRTAAMVSLGIPFSFLGAILFMHFWGMSLNMLTMFGMIVVLGMIVDDAIIIAENCYRYMEKGVNRLQAAVQGAQQVTAPVIAAVLTTCAAFLPLLLMEGLMGKFMSVLPIVISFALLASLFEAFVILPSHIAEWSHATPKNYSKPGSRRRFWYEGIVGFYRFMLKKCIRYRYATLVAILSLAVLSAWFAWTKMDFILFQNRDINYFRVNVEMPTGTTLERTSKALAQLENEALRLPKNEIDAVVAYIGYQVDEWGQLKLGSHFGQIWMDISETSARGRVGMEIMNDYRTSLPAMPEIKKLSIVKEAAGPPQGEAVSVRIRGDDWAVLQKIAREVEDYLASIDGVVDIRNNFQEGKPELRVKVDRIRASQLGLTPEDVAVSMRFAFDGGEAGNYFDRDDELDIVVRSKENRQNRIQDINKMRFLNRQGEWVPFQNFASLIPGGGFAQITRFNNRRTLSVTAEVLTDKITSVEANRLVREKFSDADREGKSAWRQFTDMLTGKLDVSTPCRGYPGYSLNFGGENEETQRSLSSLLRAFFVSIVLIYFIMATVFRSYIQPLIVLFTIPFSFIGVIFGLFVMGQPIGIMSLIGVISLNGIVVNDAIVLVDFINQARRRGIGRWRSVYESGVLRIRPIILTSVTTIGGLLPLTVWVRGTSEFLSPMAIAISWGLAFATLLTLLVLPCIYCIVDDLKTKLGMRLY
ncbi:MAG: efflux RND transporter permease subunit [Candidatus Omnitrophica bacterium]|nr:efflux RND transporter permease subunit [Candidatus Omnitrophota bacterium]